MMEEIKVSIICIAFNHEKYIRKAIESFLEQKTNFPFEILIHDDASNDTTADIIREFAKKHPDIIIPILQKNNKYSKGIDFLAEDVLPKAHGKYIALCEGDDYWIDESKLQRQYDYMEHDEKCSLCFHNAIIVDRGDRTIKKSFLPSSEIRAKYYKDEECDYTIDEMICLEFVPTNSLFSRTQHFQEYLKFVHNKKYVCGDLPMRLIMGEKGISHYFPEKMSAYRSGVENSASARAFNSTPLDAVSTLVGHFIIYDDFNRYTEGRYQASIEQSKEILLFYHYMTVGARIIMKWEKFKGMYKQLSMKHRISFFLQAYFPVIHKMFMRMRSRYRSR